MKKSVKCILALLSMIYILLSSVNVSAKNNINDKTNFNNKNSEYYNIYLENNNVVEEYLSNKIYVKRIIEPNGTAIIKTNVKGNVEVNVDYGYNYKLFVNYFYMQFKDRSRFDNNPNFKKLYIGINQGTIGKQALSTVAGIISHSKNSKLAAIGGILQVVCDLTNKEYMNYSDVLYEIRLKDDSYYCHLHSYNYAVYDRNGKQLYANTVEFESIGG